MGYPGQVKRIRAEREGASLVNKAKRTRGKGDIHNPGDNRCPNI